MTAASATSRATAGETTIGDLVPEFRISLRAQNKSDKTIKAYVGSAELLAAFLAKNGMPTAVARITREYIEAFIADQLDRWTAETAATRYRCLQQFFRWCEEEGEVPITPMARMKPPAIPEVEVPMVDEADLRKLLKVCDTRDFAGRRDTAIIRLFVDSGLRCAELAGMSVDDLNIETQIAHVLGKGRRPRACPFGDKTAQALARYMRERRKQKNAKLDALWLGIRGRLSESGIRQMVERRCDEAEIPRFHPHQLRHTWAGWWEGEDRDLMELGGWRTREMVDRYGKARAGERARDAYRRHSPGDNRL